MRMFAALPGPGATEAQIKEAHGHAYGGAIANWQRLGYLAATLARAVYIVNVDATGGSSYAINDGADDKVPPLRRVR